MSPPDFDAFAPLKGQLRGSRYNNHLTLVNAIGEEINQLSQNGQFLGVRRLPEKWKAVINSGGDYI
jgi:hypothetical protein